MKNLNKYILIVLLFTIYACSAEYHKKAFFKKGGNFECIPELIKSTDTLITSSGDTIITTSIDTVYKPEIYYKTKWQVRFDNKRFKDSLNFIKSRYRDSLKYAYKNNKVNNKKEIKINKNNNRKDVKKSRNIYLFILMYILGLVTIPLLKYGKKQIGRF